MKPGADGPGGLRSQQAAFDAAMREVLASLLARHRAFGQLRQAMPPDDQTYLDLVERRLLASEDALVCWLKRYDEEIILQRPPSPPTR